MAVLDVVITGAGIAGLACAQRLQQAGYASLLLEKSRGLGGRLATRRMDGIPIDHGARFLQPHPGTMLETLLRQWLQHGVLVPWQPYTAALDPSGQMLPADEPPATYYVAPAGMSAVGKAIAAELPIHRQQRVIAIAPTPDQTWQITTQHADTSDPQDYTARALVLAIPAPQIQLLLAPLHSSPALTLLQAAIAAVHYTPCITVMAHYGTPPTNPLPSVSCPPTAPWMVQGHPDSPFFWAGLDSSKRPAPGTTVVVHSSGAFAASWLDAPNLQVAGATLLTAAGHLIAPWLATPDRWQVHRWRYAQVSTPCPQGVLSTAIPGPLAACGDWCGNNQVASALEAGWTAAARINTLLDNRSLPDTLTFTSP